MKLKAILSIFVAFSFALSSCDKKNAMLVNRRTATPERIEEIKEAQRAKAREEEKLAITPLKLEPVSESAKEQEPASDSNKDSVTETVTEPKAEGSPLEKSVAPLKEQEPASDSNKDSVTETVTEPKAEGSPLEKSVAPLTPAQAPAPTPEPKLTADCVRKFLADHGGLEWLKSPYGQD